MAAFRDMTIKRRLFVVIMITNLVVVSVASIVSVVFSARNSKDSLQRDLMTLAEIISDNCLVSLTYNIPEDASKLLSSLKRRPSIEYAVIHNAEGIDFAEYSLRDNMTPIHSHPATDNNSK